MATTRPARGRNAAPPTTRRAGGGATRKAATGAAARGRSASAWSNVVTSPSEQYRLKRNAVLREAARAFNARGFGNTSLDDVAATLGVTKAALYYYVRGKQEILYECHMMTYDLGDQALAHARANGRSGLERAALTARRFIELFTSELGGFAVLREHHALAPAQRAEVQRRRDAFDHALRAFVEEGVADGSVRELDPKLAVLFFMGAVNWMCAGWFRPDGPMSSGDIAAGFEDLLVAAIRAPSAPAGRRVARGPRR